MSAECDLMRDIAEASNKGKQDELAEIITSNSFEGMKRAATMAVRCFELTEENIKLHSNAAIKLANLEEPESFREALRHSLLVDKLNWMGLLAN